MLITWTRSNNNNNNNELKREPKQSPCKPKQKWLSTVRILDTGSTFSTNKQSTKRTCCLDDA